MIESKVSVILIPQLKDNYSYLIKDNFSNKSIIIDPAEAGPILEYINKNDLNLKSILITHHHDDHTAGVDDILKSQNVLVYSPSYKIFGTTNLVKHNSIIDLDFIKIEVLETPGHTLDHVVYYNKKNKILFSGDTLFRLGCGRIFEGSIEMMYQSLKKIERIDNNTLVYCGHEYTLNNLSFLESIFPNHEELSKIKEKIIHQLHRSNSSIPFNLGEEKQLNPFLSTKSAFYETFKKNNNFNDFEMFSHIRKLKDDY